MASLVSALDTTTNIQYGENNHIEYQWSNIQQEQILQISFQIVRTNDSNKKEELANKFMKCFINGSNEDKEETFNKLKRECIDTINNKLNVSSDLDLKDKLLKVKDKLLNTDFSLDNFKTDIGKIYDLNESI